MDSEKLPPTSKCPKPAGRLAYCHNWSGRAPHKVDADSTLPAARLTVRFDFAYDGGAPGAGGVGTLHGDDQPVAHRSWPG